MQIGQIILNLGSPRRFYHFCGLLLPWCILLSLFFMAYGLVSGLFFAPADYQQGDAFRIMYVHVPCAMFSLLLYAAIAVCSAIFLIWHIKIAGHGGLLSGSYWRFFYLWRINHWFNLGEANVGTWWVWDARLTSELILLFLYLGYLGLYHAIPSQKAAAKACAILALVGVVDVPIIHYCVNWWSTLHQGATISQWGKPAIEIRC